jgi:LysM repeat protein
MSSLDRHLRCLDDHGGLRFHPDCPVCQQRLAGTLRRERLVSRQAQAGLVAGLLAFSAVTPGVSLAQQLPRAAQTPPPAPPVDPTLDPDWQPPGPEGPSVPEPPEAAPPSSDDGQGGTADEEVGPVESEPLQDVIPEPQEIEPPPAATPAPLTTPTQEPAPVEEAPITAPATPAETPPPPVARAAPSPAGQLVEQPQGQAAVGTTRVIRIGLEPNPPATPAGGTPAVVAPAPAQTAAPAPVSSPSAETVAVTQDASTGERQISGDTYVVRPGDSLWSIARRLLGPGASPAQIARKVNRLWELNKDRISTGDPDLLRVGIELKL